MLEMMEKKMTAIVERRMQAHEQHFMTLLEGVIESNEAVKTQMSKQISTL